MANKKIISLQVDIDLYEKLRKVAYESHSTISKIIRLILDKHFNNNGEKDK